MNETLNQIREKIIALQTYARNMYDHAIDGSMRQYYDGMIDGYERLLYFIDLLNEE